MAENTKQFTPTRDFKHGSAFFKGPTRNEDGSIKKAADTLEGPANVIDYFIANGWAVGPDGQETLPEVGKEHFVKVDSAKISTGSKVK